jgi:hypothetical protein
MEKSEKLAFWHLFDPNVAISADIGLGPKRISPPRFSEQFRVHQRWRKRTPARGKRSKARGDRSWVAPRFAPVIGRCCLLHTTDAPGACDVYRLECCRTRKWVRGCMSVTASSSVGAPACAFVHTRVHTHRCGCLLVCVAPACVVSCCVVGVMQYWHPCSSRLSGGCGGASCARRRRPAVLLPLAMTSEPGCADPV